MCGICGVRRFGPTPISIDMINIMLIECQKRGNHATGVAIQQVDGAIHVHKSDDPAWEFVASPGYKEFMEAQLKGDSVAVLGHTRMATQGSPADNNNNHPMFAGKTAVVHNGVITNDDWQFREMKLERKAETDSDIIRAILDTDGFTVRAINRLAKLSGSAAFAAVSTDFPGKLLLGRSGGPIELATTDDHLLWASTRDAIHKALRPYEKKFGFMMRKLKYSDASFITMQNDSAYLIGDQPKPDDDWLEWHQEMRISYSYTPRVYACNETYHTAQTKFYKGARVDVIQCPNPKCGVWIPITKVQISDLKRWHCKLCKTNLTEGAK